MTLGEAIAKGFSGGYILRIARTQGLETYLTDYRRKGRLTTPYPAEAEWFQYLQDARESAGRASFYTTFTFVPVEAPARIEQFGALQRIGPEPEGKVEYGHPLVGVECPDCGSIRTATVGGCNRCFRCGNAWRADFDAALDLTGFNLDDPLDLMAIGNAIEDYLAEGMDDDDADLTSASLSHPGAKAQVVAPEVCP